MRPESSGSDPSRGRRLAATIRAHGGSTHTLRTPNQFHGAPKGAPAPPLREITRAGIREQFRMADFEAMLQEVVRNRGMTMCGSDGSR
jgi:hypothetical protein